MRIDILAIGSHGDVQPCVALGLGLQRAGHHVRIVTLGGFEALVRGRGLDHLVIGASPRDIANTVAGRYWIERRAGTVGFLRGFVRVAAALIEEGIASYWQACRDAEVLVVTPMGLPVGMHIAERLRVPLLRASFAPTRYDCAGRGAVRAAWIAFCAAVFRLLIWTKLRHVTNAARRDILALPPLPWTDPYRAMNRKRIPVLDAYSPAVVPRPPAWDHWIHVTGYWFLDETPGWEPPGALVDFLRAGAPPVIVSFGSTPFPEPAAATALVVQALARACQRGVVLAGGSGLATGRLSDEVLSLEFVPHGWLFSQGCAVVHHGGAGVTGVALRAGLPSQTPPRHPCHQWELKLTGSSRGKSPLGTRHFLPYTRSMYYML